ncbi:PhzF family phenazine biosynthesis protein [Streptomyces sp. H27-D2]|uniref:PhzF family phenazine biosynthesis protein n=1 Tax=Streptomyces sp. H27-D2 TaxID=3046304 RepID=UPI002DBCB586|nr:PhzF family phenazine biosynthesis protein [Streptomyces sp. H27-D2]MEC4016355.1 PhzF family phenazine biosynthesis protein [Streptomyces sp. H27-D2]
MPIGRADRHGTAGTFVPVESSRRFGRCSAEARNWTAPSTGSPSTRTRTAFALPLADQAAADWAIRWFTPLVEASLCGHATLATAHVLRAERGLLGAVRFMSRRHGVLVTHADDGGDITLDFPAVRGIGSLQSPLRAFAAATGLDGLHGLT